MAHFERIRDVIHGPLSEQLMRQRADAGWQVISIEWRRELPGDAPAGSIDTEDVPYGLRLSEDCLRVMSQHLQKNICNLPLPGFLAHDVDDNEVARCVPPHLQYACLYWVNHLRESGCDLRDSGAVHQFLQKHFLYWLEALSLMRKTSDSLSMVLQLESMLMVSAWCVSARIPPNG